MDIKTHIFIEDSILTTYTTLHTNYSNNNVSCILTALPTRIPHMLIV